MDGFIGEIRAFAFNYVPEGWLSCIGQQLPIQQYAALYSLIGVRYGGDSRTYFNLPNLQGVVLTGMGQLPGGNTYPINGKGGTETETLSINKIPAHPHLIQGQVTTSQITKLVKVPTNLTYLSNVVSTSDNKIGFLYGVDTNPGDNVLLNQNTLGISGGGGPHTNMAPYLPMSVCICIEGVYPMRPQ